MKTMSQKQVRQLLNNPEFFKGGVFMTTNGIDCLFIQTAEERQSELDERDQQQQVTAMLKLVNLSQKDLEGGDFTTARKILAKRLEQGCQ